MMGEDRDYDPIRDRGAKRRFIKRKSDRKRRRLKNKLEKQNQLANKSEEILLKLQF